MTEITALAPAKLNLFLHITGQRPDGYHELQTAFQLLDVGDWLTFRLRADEQLTLSPEMAGIAFEDNLITRAARALQNAMRERGLTPGGADITIDKRLPTGGGIGGGSSNAATTLLALNKLWGKPLSQGELMALATPLGADVPVFVAGRSAWAEGIGERLTPIELPPKWYLVVCPDCHVATAEIFCHKDLTRDTAPIKVAAFLQGGGRNDCQPLVRKLYPDVDKALNWLKKNSTNAKMTGTGASAFSAFDSPEPAQLLLDRLPAEFSGFIARGVQKTPGLEQLL